MMKVASLVTFAVLFFVPSASCGQNFHSSPPGWRWGCWVVRKLLPTSGVSGLHPKQVHAIIGIRIVFHPDFVRSGKFIAKNPRYSVGTLSDREFFEQGYV